MINETKTALNNSFDVAVIIGGSNNLLLSQSHSRFLEDLESTGYPVYRIKNISGGRITDKRIVTTLKHEKSLQFVKDMILNNPEKKFIIFDDESDYGKY